MIPYALCSRNFQNVKLRLDFVERVCELNNIQLLKGIGRCSRRTVRARKNFQFAKVTPPLIILPLLGFYVKSFGEFKRAKNVIFVNFWGSEFSFLVNLSIFQVPNLPKIQCSLQNCQKWQFLDFLNSPKLWFT